MFNHSINKADYEFQNPKKSKKSVVTFCDRLYMSCNVPVKIVAILDAQLFENHLCQSMSVFSFDENPSSLKPILQCALYFLSLPFYFLLFLSFLHFIDNCISCYVFLVSSEVH